MSVNAWSDPTKRTRNVLLRLGAVLVGVLVLIFGMSVSLPPLAAQGEADGVKEIQSAQRKAKKPVRAAIVNGFNVSQSPNWRASESILMFEDLVVAADFDNDGDPDIFAGRERYLYQNQGLRDGLISFDMVQQIVNPSGKADSNSQVVDVNGDGFLDLAIAGGRPQGGVSREIIINPGINEQGELLKTWDEVIFIDPDNTQSTFDMAFGDFDRDGRMDVVGVGQGNAAVYRNTMDTDIAFTKVLTHAEMNLAIHDGERHVETVDIDLDGDLDFSVGSRGLEFYLCENQTEILGEITFFCRESTFTNSAGGSALGANGHAWGDYNGDKFPDVAITNQTQTNIGEVLIYQNMLGDTDDIGQAFESMANFVFPISFSRNAAAEWGDMDNDGDLDLFAGMRLYRNQNGAFPEGEAWAPVSETYVRGGVLVDLENDNDLDIVVGNQDTLVAHLNEGHVMGDTQTQSMSFSDTPQTVVGAVNVLGMALGDVDNNQTLDLVTANGTRVGSEGIYNNPLRWGTEWRPLQNDLYLNQGGDSYVESTWQPESTRISLDVAWGDINNDGFLDLAVGNSPSSDQTSDGLNEIYLNNGGVLSNTPMTFGLANGSTVAIKWGDFNGDGNLDLLSINSDLDSKDKLFFGDGTGNLTLSGWSPDFGSSYDAAVGDLDGDSDLDVAISRENTIEIYFNENGQVLADSPKEIIQVPNEGKYAQVALADFDADIDLDLAIAPYRAPAFLFRNDLGSFSKLPIWESDGADPHTALLWTDMNGDGYPDLITASTGHELQTPRKNKIFLNQRGTLSNVPNWQTADAGHTHSIVTGDINRDGLPDLVAGSGTAIFSDGDPYDYIESYLSDRIIPAFEDEAPSMRITQFGHTNGFGRPQILSGTLRVLIETFQPNGYVIDDPSLQFSANGGGRWFPAMEEQNPESPVSMSIYEWDADPIDIVDVGVVTATMYIGNLEAQYVLGNIEDINVKLDIEHSNVGDLNITLISPNGTRATLIQGSNLVDSGGENLEDTVLNDKAVIDINQAEAPFGGFFIPEEPLSIFDGQSMIGVWQLVIEDTATEDIGSLKNWGIDINGSTRDELIYHWDTLASEFFGQSDNIMVRADAVVKNLHPVQALNRSQQTTSVTAMGTPRRVRGNQIRVIHPEGDPLAGATVYRLSNEFNDSVERTSFSSDTTPKGIPDAGDDVGQVLDTISVESAAIIEDLDVEVTIQHPWVNDLVLLLEGPNGQTVELVYDVPPNGANFTKTIFDDDALQPILEGTPPFTGRYIPISPLSAFDGMSVQGDWTLTIIDQYSIDEGTLINWEINIKEAGSGRAAENATDSSKMQRVENLAGQPFYTNLQGFLQGQGILRTDDRLFAMAPIPAVDEGITFTDKISVFHTSGDPTPLGLETDTFTTPGIVNLEVTKTKVIMLLNLNVTLEWDARNDPEYLAQLDQDIKRSSEILFDLSNGQMALGDINIYQANENRDNANIVVLASNNQRPNATLGGIVTQPMNDELKNGEQVKFAFLPGQIRMGSSWNRYGNPGGTLGEDWPRALAHELAHYSLFVLDNYLGVRDGVLVETNCQGSAMTDAYRQDYSEFLSRTITNADGFIWTGECLETVSEFTTGRSDWETVLKFYPFIEDRLEQTQDGPVKLPLAVTEVKVQEVAAENNSIEAPFVYIANEKGASVPLRRGDASGYLIKTNGNDDPTDDRVILLGTPNGPLIQARGASPGDQVCVYDMSPASGSRIGCLNDMKEVSSTIKLRELEFWRPDITVRPANSTTLAITVTQTNVEGDVLQAQVFPTHRPTDTIRAELVELNRIEGEVDVFAAEIDYPLTVLHGHVRVWEEGGFSEKQAMQSFFVSMGWNGNEFTSWNGNEFTSWNGNEFTSWNGNEFTSWNGNEFTSWNGNSFGGWHAPVSAPDGQVIIFNIDDILGINPPTLLEPLANPIQLDSWLTAVGQAYRYEINDDSNEQNYVIQFQYLSSEIPSIDEDQLTVYYLPNVSGSEWQRLATNIDAFRNLASAKMPGEGIYVLIATIGMPPFEQGWNNFGFPVYLDAGSAEKSVDEVLLSIDGKYSSVYHFDSDNSGRWMFFDPTIEARFPAYESFVNDLNNLEYGKGYWIHMSEASDVFLEVPDAGNRLAEQATEFLPATFFGEVRSSFDGAVEGAIVEARIDNAICATSELRSIQNDLVYKLQVPADAGNGCGQADRKVTLFVNSVQVSIETNWDNTRANYVPLGPTDFPGAAEFHLYLPITR